jgi:type I restriction enzyme R subunit
VRKITENDVEGLAIDKLIEQGFEYRYGPDIAPDGDEPERGSYGDVLLVDRLINSLRRINPKVPDESLDYAVRKLERLNDPVLLSNNETFHRLATEGLKVTYSKDGEQRGDIVWLIDFNDPYNNDFLAVNQFTVIENNINKRPDMVLFVNGMPLVVIEVKNPTDENATIKSAYRQLETYKQAIPSLFAYNAFNVITDGLEARAGSLSARFGRYMAWKTKDGISEASTLINQLEVLLEGMLNKETLLDILAHFIVFQKSRKEDIETGQISVVTVKILAAYHQYYAVKKAVERAVEASDNNGDGKGGVIWHTQGSGKSLSMVFYTGKLVLALNNPTIVVITDRNDLDDQLFDTFASSKQLLRQEPKQANSRENLKELLKVASGGIVFTTIHKFYPEEGNVYEELSDRKNIIVIVDEAHRSHYGFAAKTIDDKDENGNVIGKKTVYGMAKYLRDGLPNATYIGFTGTPIELKDRNTPAVFGNYIDIYDIAMAVDDGSTVPIYYESRLAKIYLTEEGKKLVQEVDEELAEEEISETQKAKAKWTQLESLIGSEKRVKQIAKDIVYHFEERQQAMYGKGMIVSMSRRIAVDLYNEITKLRPAWHNDNLAKGSIKVVMTAASSDGPVMAKHHTNKRQRRMLAERMKSVEDELKLVIVCDMWLTGFDVPCLHTMYLDKPMSGHTLMQAIARVNRVYKEKPAGLIVDYLGIASDLKKALSFYSESGGKGEPVVAQEKAVEVMLEKLEIISEMFYGFEYEEYFVAETSRKLAIILKAEEHILNNLEDGKKRFIDEVTALSKAFAIAIPHEAALEVKEEVSFFQAVKSRLVKFETKGRGKTNEEVETIIRQVIDKAIATDKVVDIFDAAGLKKPDISILSEEFLLEVKNMEHKNLAVQVLKKLLDDEIKSRTRTNLIQSKKLMEMLEEAIKKYHNRILTAIEVIDELIEIGKQIQAVDKEPEEMGISSYEYAFYTAIANNKSARELMQKDKLRELAVVLYEKVRKNATIDWTIKESARAKLKVMVKRTLRKYGYPPDMRKLATETVLKQAELIADELTKQD